MDKKKEVLEIIRFYEDSTTVTENLEGCVTEEMYEQLAERIVKLFAIPDVSERTLGIDSCAALIKSMPTDQAIQIMKSDITGQPQTSVIAGELVVCYVR